MADLPSLAGRHPLVRVGGRIRACEAHDNIVTLKNIMPTIADGLAAACRKV